MKLCIDSQAFIWGIKEQATAGQEHMIEKAKSFFSWCDHNSHDILIPTIVIAEVLTPEPAATHPKYMEIINRNFMVVGVDAAVAVKYAQILYNRFNELKQVIKDNQIPRDKMKLDHLIVACALVNNANCIYSYDAKLKTFANNLIDVREFPSSTIQFKLNL